MSENKEELDCLIEENNRFVKEKNLWQELEQEQEEEEENRSWYRRFGGKVIDIAKNGLSEEMHKRLAEVRVHYSEEVEVEQKTGGTKAEKAEKKFSTLVKVVRNISNLVYDHGAALEFLRKVFVLHDERLEKVEAKIESGGVNSAEYFEMTVNRAVESKLKEVEVKLKHLEDTLDTVKAENAEIKRNKVKFEDDLDESMQRSLKGNLLITCPPKQGQPSRLIQKEKNEGVRVYVESPTEMCCRLIKEKTGAEIKPADVSVCQKLPNKEHSWLLGVANRAPQSGWETLTAGMRCGRNTNGGYFKEDGVFLSYQLTATKSKLLHQVRLARTQAKKIHKFSVNENGRITVLKEKLARTAPGEPRNEPWRVVKNEADLAEICGPGVIPLRQERRGGEEEESRPVGRRGAFQNRR